MSSCLSSDTMMQLLWTWLVTALALSITPWSETGGHDTSRDSLAKLFIEVWEAPECNWAGNHIPLLDDWETRGVVIVCLSRGATEEKWRSDENPGAEENNGPIDPLFEMKGVWHEVTGSLLSSLSIETCWESGSAGYLSSSVGKTGKDDDITEGTRELQSCLMSDFCIARDDRASTLFHKKNHLSGINSRIILWLSYWCSLFQFQWCREWNFSCHYLLECTPITTAAVNRTFNEVFQKQEKKKETESQWTSISS